MALGSQKEKVQLTMPGGAPPGLAHDAKKVIQQEMVAVRQSTSTLPKLARMSQANAAANINGMAKTLDVPRPRSQGALPKVSADSRMDRIHAARRGAAIMGALGHPELDKLAAKEEQDKKKRKQRLLQLGKQAQAQGGRRPSHAAGFDGDDEEDGGRRRAGSHGHAGTSGRVPSLPPFTSAQRGGGHAQAGERSGRAGQGVHTGRSHRDGRNAAGRYGGRNGRGGVWEEEQSSQRPGGVREASRVGKLVAEFGGKDDWVSKTILRHQMATVLQANVRGWLIRLRWAADKYQVVDDLHAKLHAAATAEERSAKLRRQLEMRAMTRSQKKVASNVLGKLFGRQAFSTAGSMTGPTRNSRWNKLAQNADLAAQQMAEDGERGGGGGRDLDSLAAAAGGGGSGSGSEFSDLEMEDITAVKMRARTPPWQKVEESQWFGQYNKLNQKISQGAIDVVWDPEQSMERLAAVKERRLERQGGPGEGEDGAFDAATQALPAELIADLLYPKYLSKYARLGLLAHNPLAKTEAEDQAAAEAQAAATALAAAEQMGGSSIKKPEGSEQDAATAAAGPAG